MKTALRFLPSAAILLSLASVSCNRAVTLASTTPATWSYVEQGWGGIATGNPAITVDRVTLPFRLHVHSVERVDSAICIRRATGRVEGSRIIVRLDKSICGEGSPGPRKAADYAKAETIRFAKPAPGKYDVVYDDASAGFPKIGEVEVR